MADRNVVLVTGAAGFICYHTIERLLRAGRPVVGVDNFDPFYPRARKEQNVADLKRIAAETGTPFTFVEQDIVTLEPNAFSDQPIGSVIHLAAKAGVRPSLEQPAAYLRANVEGTLRILELCKTRKIDRLVFGSSSSVYGDSTPAPFREDAPAVQPLSPYAASKRACELYCATYAHLYGTRIASLRFFTVYGPRQRPDLAIHSFTAKILAGQPITLFGDGTTERDYTFVADIADGIVGAEKWVAQQPAHTHEIFNLGGSRSTSLDTMVTTIESALGKTAEIVRTTMQPGDVKRTSADVTKAGLAFGYAPKTSFADGIRAFAAWYTASHPQS